MTFQRRFWMVGVGLALVLGLGEVSSTRADLITVPLTGLTNANIRTYTAGGNYPIAPTTLTVGGVDFGLVPNGSETNSLGVIQTPQGNSTFTISTSIVGATEVYTLINSGTGAVNATVGRLEFVGTGGAFASFDLIEGANIRDHYNGVYVNTLTDPTVVSHDFGGGVRLDRQLFVLPNLFSTETLTEIHFIGTNAGNPQGQAFLAGVTVGRSSAVPEPSSLVSLALGVGVVVGGWRRRLAMRACR